MVKSGDITDSQSISALMLAAFELGYIKWCERGLEHFCSLG